MEENLSQSVQGPGKPLRKKERGTNPPPSATEEPKAEAASINNNDGGSSPAQGEPDLLAEANVNSEATNPPAQGGSDLLTAAQSFLSEVHFGGTFSEDSLAQGKELSRQIETGYVNGEASLDIGFAQLYVQHGQILNAYKRYADDHQLPWEENAPEWFPHLKKRKRQYLMFLANHPEVSQYPHFGLDRALRFYRAGRKVDRKKGMEKLTKKFKLIWDPNGAEALMDFRMRVDKVIAQVMGAKKVSAKSTNKRVADLRKWIDKGKTLIEEVVADEQAHGKLEALDIDPILESLNQLREVAAVAD